VKRLVVAQERIAKQARIANMIALAAATANTSRNNDDLLDMARRELS